MSAAAPDTPLAAELKRHIALEGPISVERYMALCLGHPRHGYYMTRDPFGARGDFVTAPEISQMFGELVGLWAAETWRLMGGPARLNLVELGPGRGTLMADALRAARALPAFREALAVHLVETSPVLRERQQVALASSGITPTWHATVDSLPDGPLVVVANEFFDALPVRQYQRTERGWCERLVGLGDDGALAFGLAPEPEPALTLAAPVGSVREVAAASGEVLRALAGRIVRFGGAALVVDYGHVASGFGETLQALKGHAFVDPLAEPGEADLTVHVDFTALACEALAAGAAVHGPVMQRDFLLALGLAERAGMLKRRAAADQARAIDAAVARLTDAGKTGMGRLFKVLAVASPALPLLPGFDRRQAPDDAKGSSAAG
ncbi:SAM-dependent methyltransferase [Chelatococcus sp. SYSU_G07232]|uniref:SAM-dependent methyltransferase n=1 Tax=Chelatococcus albus TaxID=3047466 RepID=A0ABT7AIS9_9HYPH|nr:SAM-dependent methyltransferase [Chelatococcus sp. SYSU_G07232]MDJ1159284.1 SAM-dependent methyltransferase [Chelatococcus sp. SYSU_G07232]